MTEDVKPYKNSAEMKKGNTRISIQIHRTLLSAFDTYCRMEGISRASGIRQLMSKKVRDVGEKAMVARGRALSAKK